MNKIELNEQELENIKELIKSDDVECNLLAYHLALTLDPNGYLAAEVLYKLVKREFKFRIFNS